MRSTTKRQHRHLWSAADPGARRRRVILALILAAVGLAVGAVASVLMYRVAVDIRRADLIEQVGSRVALIEAIQRRTGDPEQTLELLREARRADPSLGASGEFTIARREGDRLVFLLRHASFGEGAAQTVPLRSGLAEPQQRAFAGGQGAMIGRDYQGKRVLAAYRWIPDLDWGIVAKMDMAEVRAPFWRAFGVTLGIGLVLVAGGTVLCLRTSEPLIRQLEGRTWQLAERVKELDCLLELSQRLSVGEPDLERIARDAVALIPPAWQYPEITAARLEIGDCVAATPGFTPTKWSMTIDVPGDTAPIGRLQVVYREERPAEHEGPFLREERELLEAIAHRVGQAVEHVAAEAALRSSEERFRNLFNQVPVGLYRTSTDGRFLEANPMLAEILRHPDVASVLATPIAAVYAHPEDRDRWRAQLLEQGEVLGSEFEVRRADGTTAWVNHSARVVRDEQGNVIAYEGAAEDITERREAQLVLAERERLLDHVLEALPVGVWIADRDGTIVRGNPAAQRIWQGSRYVAPDEFSVYKGWWRATGEPIAAEDWALARAIRQSETSLDEQIEIECFDGLHKIILNSALPITDADGAIAGAVVTNLDITVRVVAEEQLAEAVRELERSNAELQQFAYVASHDLQEPLRMVVSYLQLLERRLGDGLDERGRTFLDFAVDGGRRMQRLIQDLLAYSRVQTHGAEFAPVELERVMRLVARNLEPAIEETGAAVSWDGLPTVLGDEGQLVQLLQNLVGNAIKFRGETPPQIDVSAERADGVWCVRVRDNGIGIAPEHTERIFDVFQRLHTRADYPGTGIGLAISKRIVERHGGTIGVESAPGEGAIFSCTIPDESEA